MTYSANIVQRNLNSKAFGLMLAVIMSVACTITAADEGKADEVGSIKIKAPSQLKQEKSAPTLKKRALLFGAGLGSSLLIVGQISLATKLQHTDWDSFNKEVHQNATKIDKASPAGQLDVFGIIGFPVAYLSGMYLIGKFSWNCFKEAFAREAKKPETKDGDPDSKKPQQADSNTPLEPVKVQ